MLDQLILHIGTHKTGTSSIQQWANTNRKSLINQGVIYPNTGQWHDHSHHQLGYLIWEKKNALKSRSTMKAVINALMDEITASKCKTAIISSELLEKACFDKACMKNLDHLSRALARRVDVVIFLRRQDLLVESVFKQWVKDPSLRLRQAPNIFIENYAKSMDYLNLVESWEKLNFASSVSIITNALHRDPVADFLRAIQPVDLSTSSFVSPKIVNKSLDGRGLQMRHALNRFPADPVIDSKLHEILMSPQFNNCRLSLFESEEMRRHYLSRFDETNSELCRKYNLETFSDDLIPHNGRFKCMEGWDFFESMQELAMLDKKITYRIFNNILLANDSARY